MQFWTFLRLQTAVCILHVHIFIRWREFNKSQQVAHLKTGSIFFIKPIQHTWSPLRTTCSSCAKSRKHFKITAKELVTNMRDYIAKSTLGTRPKLSPSERNARCFWSNHDFWQQLPCVDRIVTLLSVRK